MRVMAGTVCERRTTDSFVLNLNKVTTWNTQREILKLLLKKKLGRHALDSTG
jgi:hypothetical protein